jgi:hypothetical protein
VASESSEEKPLRNGTCSMPANDPIHNDTRRRASYLRALVIGTRYVPFARDGWLWQN